MKKNAFLGKIAVCATVLVFLAIGFIFSIPCPILTLTGIPCPGCGMTRAILALLRLDFAAAFSFHPMVFSLPLFVLFFFTDLNLFPKKWQNILSLALLGIAFLLVWLLRFF